MIYPFEEILVHASRFITLRSGDLVFTGTPAGVGPVKPGDMLEGHIGGKIALSCRII
jgi:2-keto-4-pentenoate hydratase/2-oxohepta-3-ene-1,7-dioic acid hydratase in catechol pathway